MTEKNDPRPDCLKYDQTQPPKVESEFQISERKDETQIIQEMQGETALIEEYVYSFKQGSRQVTSLSYSGIKEMVRRRGNFEILDLNVTETETAIRATVKIRDLQNRVEFIGASETEKDKPFAFVLSVNKAERNAYRKAMPAEFLAKMVDAFLHGSAQEQPAKPKQEQQQPQQSQPEQPKNAAQRNLPNADQVYQEFPPELSDLLDFKKELDYMIVKPREFLGKEAFADAAAVTRNLGGEYISAGSNSHFRIPIRTEGE